MSKSKKIDTSIINVIDLEATCWDSAGKKPDKSLTTIIEPISDIIEVGITQLNCQEQRIIKKESIVVRPTQSEVSEFCMKLTGWTQEKVKKGKTFKETCYYLQQEFLSKRRTFAGWGEYDKKQFIRQWERERIWLDRKNMWDVSFPFSDRYINIKNLLALRFGLKREIGLQKAINFLSKTKGIEIKFEGTPHSGIDDSFNTAKILMIILENKK